MSLMRASATVGGLACAVWVLSNVLTILVYLFDRHSHSHPAIDVAVFYSVELAGSLLLLRYYNISWRDAGFRAPTQHIQWFPNIALVVFLNLCLAGIMVLCHTPDMHGSFSPSEKLFLLCGYGPVTEEVFIRGWFQTAFLRRAGQARTVPAVLVSSLFFAGIHVFVGGGAVGTAATMAGAFFSGVISARLRQQSGSLLPAIVLHVIYNVTGLFLATPIYSLVAHTLNTPFAALP